MSYCARLMRREDVAQVAKIDREAFPTLWTPVNYQRELENPLAHYVAVYDDQRVVERAQSVPRRGLSGLMARLQRLFDRSRFLDELPESGGQYVVGFVGMWIMADEAHIINIAVRDSYRRRGIGELLLISAIDLAIELRARILTLEVRASNWAAKALYQRYGFKEVGLRRGYYADNREDAILMSTEEISSPSFQACLEQGRQEHSKKAGIAGYAVGR